jgi:transcriptional regulator with XRE-family HTH domain
MKPTKLNERWGDAHIQLKRLYEARVPESMSQEEFGQKYGIGTQGMVSQYLNGTRPLNFEAAAKFARGLSCTIAEISPAMAKALRAEILPLLGKAASIALVVGASLLSPAPDSPSKVASVSAGHCILCKTAFLSIFWRAVRFLTSRSPIALALRTA